ncbi:MAG: hypothetical protein IJ462_03750 [Clostridia bacterium]|nr:hypothetical protein [Clostridia bacterium]
MRKIKNLIKRYGERVSFGEKDFFAIITPFSYRSRTFTEGDYTPIGYTDAANYMMIASSDADLKGSRVGSIIYAESGEYILYHSDNFYFKGKCIYCFAYLKRRVA